MERIKNTNKNNSVRILTLLAILVYRRIRISRKMRATPTFRAKWAGKQLQNILLSYTELGEFLLLSLLVACVIPKTFCFISERSLEIARFFIIAV